jgi:FAD/FMN-containing dehydrogenase
MDTIGPMPTRELSLINMDPDFPLPYAGEGLLLTDLPEAAIDGVIEAFVGSPLLHLEVRHLGGAAAEHAPEHGVLDAIDQPFLAFTFGMAPDADAHAAMDRQIGVVLAALGPWDSGRRYLNFAESATDPRSIFPTETYDRFRRAKASYDPTGTFLANHPIDRAAPRA